MSEDQFTKLFKYVQEARQEVADIKDTMSTRDDIHTLTVTD